MTTLPNRTLKYLQTLEGGFANYLSQVECLLGRELGLGGVTAAFFVFRFGDHGDDEDHEIIAMYSRGVLLFGHVSAWTQIPNLGSDRDRPSWKPTRLTARRRHGRSKGRSECLCMQVIKTQTAAECQSPVLQRLLKGMKTGRPQGKIIRMLVGDVGAMFNCNNTRSLIVAHNGIDEPIGRDSSSAVPREDTEVGPVPEDGPGEPEQLLWYN
ncbi:hypothetical protein CTA1_2640 [Colletotrichum tanaceti]|uniref:Uncharacterized protein n=1 Tax=Colletotrichum tanaceti TaxID=1306861 RepID=A0A4U6X8R5_9PEZI|nr:hypothetical protein CTA1_2640 [Colletotrichum tanaceti]